MAFDGISGKLFGGKEGPGWYGRYGVEVEGAGFHGVYIWTRTFVLIITLLLISNQN